MIGSAPATSRLSARPTGFGWMLLCVALLAAGVYANSLRNGFVFDDWGIIVSNPSVQELHWAEIWQQNYWPPLDGPPGDMLYRPLTIFSYLLNHALSPETPWPFHVVNVTLHVFNSVLVSVLAWRLFRRVGVAFLTGVLFAVHPLHTEAVANVVGRAELLAAFWSLAAVLIFLPQTPLLAEPEPRRGLWHGWLVALCILLALLCKETPILLPAALVTIDLWRWSHWNDRPRLALWLRRRLWDYYLPAAVAVGCYLAARLNAVGLMIDTQMIHPLVNPLVEATWAQRIVTPFMLLAKYMVLFVWPRTLAADYSVPSLLPTHEAWKGLALAGELLVLAGSLTVTAYWKKRPALALSVLLFALGYALVANFLRIGTIFGERLFYWPSIFVCMWAALAAMWVWTLPARWPQIRWLRPLTVTAFVFLLALLGGRTWLRNPDWKSNEELALATAQDNSQSSKALAWAGQVLLNSDNPAWYPIGETLIRESCQLYDRPGRPYWELAKHYYRENRRSDALLSLAMAALRDGGQVKIHNALLVTRDEMRQWPVEEYLPGIQVYVTEHPKDPAGYLALALARRAQGDTAASAEALHRALTLDSYFHEAAAELGMQLLEQGRAPEAVDKLRKYAGYAFGNAEAYCQLAFALMKLDPQQYPEALQEADRCLNKALALDAAGHQAKVRELRTEWIRRRSELAAIEKTLTAGNGNS